jgi:GT2 family glycosyltransferase
VNPLSFIIITYNRPEDALALMVNIAGLDNAAGLLQEIILVNNKSTADYTAVRNFISTQAHLPFKYIDAPENLGVARGRNFALKFATAPILILLDDDAELQNKDALEQVIKAFEHKPGPPQLDQRETAIVSFKVLYYETLQMQENALPHKQFKKYKDLQSFYTYYYAGGAHAIKRKVFDEIGYYPEDFFYGMEEYDMSYRLIDKGYAIQYNSGIVMLHKESPHGRKSTPEKLKMMWVNKSKVAWRYLPSKYFASTTFLWSFEYLRKTTFSLKNFFVALRSIRSIPSTEKKKRVSESTLKYLKQVKARLHY